MLQLQCCVCLRVKVPHLDGYGQPAAGILPEASHTYCPTCAADALLQLEELRTTR